MFGISFTQLIVILVLALILIGPKQLPEVARQIARFLNELRRASSVITDEFKAQMREDQFSIHSQKPTVYQDPPPHQPDPPLEDATEKIQTETEVLPKDEKKS